MSYWIRNQKVAFLTGAGGVLGRVYIRAFLDQGSGLTRSWRPSEKSLVSGVLELCPKVGDGVIRRRLEVA